MPKISEGTTAHLQQYLQDKHNAEWCSKYGEPGYPDPAKGVVLANWNNVPKRIADYLEEAGFSLEWSDEWWIDYANEKAYRTRPDSYHWESQIHLTRGGDYITPDDPFSDWLEELQATDYAHEPACLPSRYTEQDLAEHGFVLFADQQENGFHASRSDTPEPVQKAAFEKGAEAVIFRKVENSQFYIVYQCYAKFPEDV